MKRNHGTQLVSATPREELADTQPCLTDNLYEVPSASPYEIAESMEIEQQIYETPCESEEGMGPIYHVPSSSEYKIYEEFEGKRFRKLYHKEVM